MKYLAEFFSRYIIFFCLIFIKLYVLFEFKPGMVSPAGAFGPPPPGTFAGMQQAATQEGGFISPPNPESLSPPAGVPVQPMGSGQQLARQTTTGQPITGQQNNGQRPVGGNGGYNAQTMGTGGVGSNRSKSKTLFFPGVSSR